VTDLNGGRATAGGLQRPARRQTRGGPGRGRQRRDCRRGSAGGGSPAKSQAAQGNLKNRKRAQQARDGPVCSAKHLVTSRPNTSSTLSIHAATCRLPNAKAEERQDAESHGQGGCCARSHCSTSSLPAIAAHLHVISPHGQGGCCDRSHRSTSRWPLVAALKHVSSSHGQGGRCARSHRRTPRWPPFAADSHVRAVHASPGQARRIHRSAARSPCRAARSAALACCRSVSSPRRQASWTAHKGSWKVRHAQRSTRPAGAERPPCPPPTPATRG
jgi:hypothetical protein